MAKSHKKRAGVTVVAPDMNAEGSTPRQTSNRLQVGFGIKRKQNGSIVRFNARLVAKGFTQRPGV